MTKVYVVLQGVPHEGYGNPLLVTLSLEKAKAFADSEQSKHKYSWLEVFELDIDKPQLNYSDSIYDAGRNKEQSK